MIISSNGTPIAYHRSGGGPPLILVPGTGAANPVAWTVFPALEQHFTVYAVDRRGHGESGDSQTYAIEDEFEDIATVVDSIGEPANLLGHSYGALCALEAALLTRNIRKLVLYEGVPNPLPDVPVYPEGFLDQLDARLKAGDREGVLIAHYSQNAGLTLAEIEQFKASPAWPERMAIAHTIPRELRADEQYRFDAQRFQNLWTPTLLLLGGDSPDLIKMGTQAVNTALPNSQVAILQGQGHIAMYTNPDLFLHEVLTFLNDPK